MDIDGILWEIRYKAWGLLAPWRHLKRFLFVVKNWGRYRGLVASFYSPWMDITEGGELLYHVKPENMRCRFCGAEYPQIKRDNDWARSFEPVKEEHRPGCLWIEMIEPLRREQVRQ